MDYARRIVDDELAERLAGTGAVSIEGPRACGKTETARQIAASETLLDVDPNAREAAAIDPALILGGPTPRLIDEWQLEPTIWDHVRRTVDERGRAGQFILTGSALPADEATRHTGAGRITRMRMRPMTLFETGGSTGEISLAGLLRGEPVGGVKPGLSIADLAREIAIGGWPGFRTLSVERGVRAVRDYLEEIRRADVGRINERRRDPNRVGRLLVSLARNVATNASVSTLANDTGGAEGSVGRDTVREYLEILERLMIVEDQPAWAPHMRSRYVLRGAPKRHFVDPSLAVAALRATPERLPSDMSLFGLLFESLVIRDLRVYAQGADGMVLHYRDSDGLEVDAIVEIPDGRWAAFEIKLGAHRLEEGARSLKKFIQRIDTSRCGMPATLGVIVGAGYGYMRDDGIAVIPIGGLGP